MQQEEEGSWLTSYQTFKKSNIFVRREQMWTVMVPASWTKIAQLSSDTVNLPPHPHPQLKQTWNSESLIIPAFKILLARHPGALFPSSKKKEPLILFCEKIKYLFSSPVVCRWPPNQIEAVITIGKLHCDACKGELFYSRLSFPSYEMKINSGSGIVLACLNTRLSS